MSLSIPLESSPEAHARPCTADCESPAACRRRRRANPRRPRGGPPAGGLVRLGRPCLLAHQLACADFVRRSGRAVSDRFLRFDVRRDRRLEPLQGRQLRRRARRLPFDVNPAGFVIASAIHGARHDAGCMLHVHSLDGIAVCAQQCGVLPLSQRSTFVLAALGYHDYKGIALRDDEKPRLVADPGRQTFLMPRGRRQQSCLDRSAHRCHGGATSSRRHPRPGWTAKVDGSIAPSPSTLARISRLIAGVMSRLARKTAAPELRRRAAACRSPRIGPPQWAPAGRCGIARC